MTPAARQAIDDYLQYVLVERRMSAHTVAAYKQDLERLRRY